MWTNLFRTRPILEWEKPRAVDLKWNTDSSSLGKPGLSGIGEVLRDSARNFVRSFSVPAGLTESNEAEVLTIKKALKISAECTMSMQVDWIIYIWSSDSENAIARLQKDCRN